MLYDQAGPEIETFAGGMKIDAGPPKFSEIKSRKVLTQIWSWFLSKIRWRPKKKRSSLEFGRVGPKLDGPQDPGPGMMYPLNPPLAGPVTRWGEGMTQHFVPQYTL